MADAVRAKRRSGQNSAKRIASKEFWAPQVSFPQSSFLSQAVECQNRFHLFTIHSYFLTKYAGVAELADAPDLGSGGTPVQVQVLSPAPNNKHPPAKRVVFHMRA